VKSIARNPYLPVSSFPLSRSLQAPRAASSSRLRLMVCLLVFRPSILAFDPLRSQAGDKGQAPTLLHPTMDHLADESRFLTRRPDHIIGYSLNVVSPIVRLKMENVDTRPSTTGTGYVTRAFSRLAGAKGQEIRIGPSV